MQGVFYFGETGNETIAITQKVKNAGEKSSNLMVEISSTFFPQLPHAFSNHR